MKKYFLLFLLFSISQFIAGCQEDPQPNSPVPVSGGGANGGGNIPDWLIPQSEVFDGGPGKDGIPALEKPPTIPVADASFLHEDDLVIGIKIGQVTRAYPHKILDWHEIINDELNDSYFSITYCPLTGTGIGWDRIVNGSLTTFGVSGLLYNTNLIPYDRNTDSNWSQMLLKSVNGKLKGQEIETLQVVETKWETWREMYPNTDVVSIKTGYSRNYDRYPYGDYKTNHNSILFPVKPFDERVLAKERTHGIFLEEGSKIYRFAASDNSLQIIEQRIGETDVVIAANKEKNYMVSFLGTLPDGTKLEFSELEDGAIIMQDNEGNKWDIFGEAVDGPRKGERLTPTNSFMGYFFALAAFYPESGIYHNVKKPSDGE
ncbi:DUF3179 domain-containing protein [Flexithrix dorotheae]|uniref:DUF3179 domain-containing protein n=1 Tax=Flexithrix dorotheae TaxID=70993 RepID=UPI0003634DF1|nr:DUF3179 domain-containing protein [Flexithrix dorotheae]